MLWQSHEAVIAHEADFEGFRREARRHLSMGVAPGELAFIVDARRVAPAEPAADVGSPLRVAPSTLALMEEAGRHADPARFELMYRLLWRLRDQPAVQHDPLDADRMRLAQMAQAVRREQHKMKAFVRFRPVDEPGQPTPLHVAWFEPAHHVLEAVAPFFVRRFAGMRFSILTPGRSLCWDGEALHWAEGSTREHAPPADAGEALWLAYYAHVFNPARLKLAAMVNEMPRRYWRNLPEAALIAPLAAAAASRSSRMLETPGTVAMRRIPEAARAGEAPGHAARAATVPPLPGDLPADADARLVLLRERAALAAHCRACPLGERATQTVPGQGRVGAALMLVGEQPGDQEDLRGQAFVGPSGQLLDRALTALGLPRDAIYLTNAVKHFKYQLRGKRRLHKTSAQQEVAACLHWLEEEIALVRPRAIVALGRTAAMALLSHDVAVSEDRGRWFAHASGTPVLVTLHPAAILRGPDGEREAAFAGWVADLAVARDRLASP